MSNQNVGTISQHQSDYKPQAWEAYTFAELGWWVHLLVKRAKGEAFDSCECKLWKRLHGKRARHREDGPKKDADMRIAAGTGEREVNPEKDLYDARNYHAMMGAKLDAIEGVK